jgi:hypothetical protein
MSPSGDFSMKKKRYSEEQIIKAIQHHEAGIQAEDIYWKSDLSPILVPIDR